MATPEIHHERQDRGSDERRDGGGRAPATLRRGAQFVLGSALLAYGRKQRSRRETAIAVGGGALVFSSLGGVSRLKAALTARGGRDSGAAAEPQPPEPAVRRSVTVGAPADELYDRWRDPGTFSQILGHVAEVDPIDEDRFRWTVEGPYGQDIGWETHVVEDEPGEVLRWETPTDAVLPNEGTVRFEPAPGDRGTIVTLSVAFDPPGGTLGSAALEQLDIAPKALAGVALDRFKSLVESGEIPTLSGNPSGRGAGDTV